MSRWHLPYNFILSNAPDNFLSQPDVTVQELSNIIGSPKRVGGYVYLPPPDSSVNNSIEKAFASDDDNSQFSTNENLRDELMEIADAVNLDAFHILNRKNESKIVKKKKNKPYYIRKNPLPRILKRDFRRDFIVMFRNVINAADQSLLHNFFTTFAHPECHFVSYNSSLPKVYTPAILHVHGIEAVVDNLAHRTLPYADFALSILNACIMQKEGMVGSKIMTQMEFRATQVLIPAPSSLAKLDSFCMCQETDRFRIQTAKAKIESYVNNSRVLFATKVNEFPPEAISTTQESPLQQEAAPAGTSNFSPSPLAQAEVEPSIAAANSKRIARKQEFPLVRKLQKAGVHAQLVSLIEYILVTAQGSSISPHVEVLEEIKNRLNNFFNNKVEENGTGQTSSSNNPLMALMSNKVDALQHLQLMRETIVKNGGFSGQIHPIIVTTMVDAIRTHFPFLPMNGKQFASMFAATGAPGNIKTAKSELSHSDTEEQSPPIATSAPENISQPHASASTSFPFASSTTSSNSSNTTSRPQDPPLTTATSKKRGRALENVLFMDVEMLIQQMQLFYSNFNKPDTSESDGEARKSTTSSSSNISSDGSDVDKDSNISPGDMMKTSEMYRKEALSFLRAGGSSGSEDASTTDDEAYTKKSKSKSRKRNSTKVMEKVPIVDEVHDDKEIQIIETMRCDTPTSTTTTTVSSADLPPIATRSLPSATTFPSTAGESAANGKFQMNFEQSPKFDVCSVCGKNKFPTPKVLEALMKPFYMNMSLRPIGTFFFNEQNEIYHMELVTPKIGCSYSISFE